MNTTAAYPVIGELQEHWSSKMTGTQFKEFRSDLGVDGLAWVQENELHLLSVISGQPGSGQFREFIRQCKEAYPFIRIWAVMNDELRPVLARYEFVRGHDVDKFGEMQEVWDWSAF